MDNYLKKDLAVSFAKKKNCHIKDLYLGLTQDGDMIWYGQGYLNTIQSGPRSVLLVIPSRDKIEYVTRFPKGIMQIKLNEAFLHNGFWCKYVHRLPGKYERNKRGSDIVITKNEILEMKDLEELKYTTLPYRCYAVLENGKCINFLWGAGSPEHFEHSIFALDTIRSFDPKVHTLHQLKSDDYIKCLPAERGLFSFDHNGLFRVDMGLLAKVRNHQPIDWL